MRIFRELKHKLSLFAKYFSSKGKCQESNDNDNTYQGRDIPHELTNNKEIKQKQNNLLILIVLFIVIAVLIAAKVMSEKSKGKFISSSIHNPKLEVASEALDPDKMWRNHFEDLLNENKRKFNEHLQLAETSFSEKEQKLQEDVKQEMEKMRVQLDFAKSELLSATEELKQTKQAYEEYKQNNDKQLPLENQVNINAMNLSTETEFDKPKDAKIYIPETSYVSGYLLGGMAVSTALNAPDENAVPVVIRLTERGNLPNNFALDISTCRILGSSYGDLSSERAIIRVEKMVCIDPHTQLVTTSNIAGTVHGPDGMNGIKGRIVSTSNKHVRNALIGGVISGLSSNAKGEDGLAITSLGGIGTKKKGITDMLGKGMLTGVSNAGEKIADYYLKMAESMSPVLTIPGGVKTDVIFMKGFYIGELSTHRRIKHERSERNQQNTINKKYEEME